MKKTPSWPRRNVFPVFDGTGQIHTDWLFAGCVEVFYEPAVCSANVHTVLDPATNASCICADGFVKESGDGGASNGKSAYLRCIKECPNVLGEVAAGRLYVCADGRYNTSATGAVGCADR